MAEYCRWFALVVPGQRKQIVSFIERYFCEIVEGTAIQKGKDF